MRNTLCKLFNGTCSAQLHGPVIGANRKHGPGHSWVLNEQIRQWSQWFQWSSKLHFYDKEFFLFIHLRFKVCYFLCWEISQVALLLSNNDEFLLIITSVSALRCHLGCVLWQQIFSNSHVVPHTESQQCNLFSIMLL